MEFHRTTAPILLIRLSYTRLILDSSGYGDLIAYGGGGHGFLGRFQVSGSDTPLNGGKIQTCSVISSGVGYYYKPVVVPKNRNVAVLQPLLQGGFIKKVKVLRPGSNYANGDLIAYYPSGGGSASKDIGNYTVINGEISTTLVTDNTDWGDPPVVPVVIASSRTDGKADAALDPVYDPISRIITGVAVRFSGSHYTDILGYNSNNPFLVGYFEIASNGGVGTPHINNTADQTLSVVLRATDRDAALKPNIVGDSISTVTPLSLGKNYQELIINGGLIDGVAGFYAFEGSNKFHFTKISNMGSASSGTTWPPIITINPEDAALEPIVEGGVVTAINIWNGGSDYSAGNLVVVEPNEAFLNGNYRKCSASYTVNSEGSINSITINDGGSGYTYPPKVYPQQPSTKRAIIEARLGECIDAIHYAHGVDLSGDYYHPFQDTLTQERLGNVPYRIWDNFKFNIPAFIQFGKAYADYDSAFPDAASKKYVYAISTHGFSYEGDQFYLGRVKVYDNTLGGWAIRDNILDGSQWEYYTGLNQEGAPVWASNVNRAASILYCQEECLWPTIMYHKPSNRYLLATHTQGGIKTHLGWKDEKVHEDLMTGEALAGDDTLPAGLKRDNHWTLWEARKPWGPWKKILTNDFHGMENDVIAEDGIEYYGFSGFPLMLMPPGMWGGDDAEDGGWYIWAAQGNNGNQFWDRNLLSGHYYQDKNSWTWDAQALGFIKIKLNPDIRETENGPRSAMSRFQQSNVVCNPVIPVDGQNPSYGFNGQVGYHFQLKRDVNVTHLGRIYVSGNTQQHDLKIYQVTIVDGQITNSTEKASATTVAFNSKNDLYHMDRNGFLYVKLINSSTGLPEPKFLAAKDAGGQPINYILVSSEYKSTTNNTAANDYRSSPPVNQEIWYGGDSLSNIRVVPANPASNRIPVNDWPLVVTGYTVDILNSVQKNSMDTNWVLENNIIAGIDKIVQYGNCYGPVNFLFSDDPIPMYNGNHDLGTSVNPEDRFVGVSFTLDTTLTLTHLGRYCITTNEKMHEVRLMTLSPFTTDSGIGHTGYTTIASVSLNANVASSGFVYEPVKTPVCLEKGKIYYLVSREFNGGDTYYQNTRLRTNYASPTLPDWAHDFNSGYITVNSNKSLGAWIDETGGGGDFYNGYYAIYCNGPVAMKFE